MYFCIPNQNIRKMKRSNRILTALVILSSLLSLASCNKPDSIIVSTQELWFNLEEGSKTIDVTANCKWTVTQNDNADWYTITPTSGKNDGTITVTVNGYPDGDYRGSTFVITSKGGHIRRTVFVSQNKLDFDGLVNKIFAVTTLERWSTDYYDQIIEDEYRLYTFNPYDTTQGYQMYFLENGKGIQRDRKGDHAKYHPFDYEYDPINSILHIAFELDGDSLESYHAQVLCASDSLYRIYHEFIPHRFERADHRKIGVILPGEKDILMQKASKRKGNDGIYQIN